MIESTDQRVSAVSPPSELRVATDEVGRMKRVQWGDRLRHVAEMSVDFTLRHGMMYKLHSVNELNDVARLRATDRRTSQRDGKLVTTYEAEGPEVRLRTELVVDPVAERVDVALALEKLEGPQRRYQLQMEPRITLAEEPAVALVLWKAGGATMVLRPLDPSGQAIADQDGHKQALRTTRLARPLGLLTSIPDRCAVMFEGDNVAYVCAWQQQGDWRRWSWKVYGRDVWLVPSDEHTQRFSLKLIEGLGGLGDDERLVEAGHGALLGQRYVTRSDRIAVHFTGPTDMRTRAELIADGDRIASSVGTGDLALGLEDLPDGDYHVIKTLETDEGTWTQREPVTLLRTQRRRVEAQAQALRAFAEGCDPSAADDPEAARHRIGLLRWKLEEAAIYQKLNEAEQVQGLLSDAERIRHALLADESARLPEPTELLYANDLTEDSDDFVVYGAGEMTFDRETGMTLEPTGTTNLWSRFELAGSYMIVFDYRRSMNEHGGTMLQICGDAVNPVRQDSLMASASWGGMDHYNFGVRTYHWSFGAPARGPNDERMSRFRRTGPGFYLLSQDADPIEPDRWHHLTFVKNGRQFLFFVDGRLVQEYFDIEAQGPFLEAGRMGIRVWKRARASFRKLRVCRFVSPHREEAHEE